MSGDSTPSGRGSTFCRGCGTADLHSVLDLGAQPLANELFDSAAFAGTVFPLHLRICSKCGLGQVGEVVSRERIFGEYSYMSSVSSSWVAHARSYAHAMHKELNLEVPDLVLEVASNDGYLLREFLALGVNVFGVEPARNVAMIARAFGVPTLTEFFGRTTAERFLGERGQPRLIVANNVMAHVPDLDDFVSGLALLTGLDTIITVENPSFVQLLRETQFDTIYHEHFSYLSAHAVATLVGRHGLELFRVEALKTHGGSYRYWIARKGRHLIDDSVTSAITTERQQGLMTPGAWADFARSSQMAIVGLRHWLDERNGCGMRIAAYGAAAKGNTLMNAAGVSARDVVLVADGNSYKQGKLLPGTGVPIVAPSALARATPTDVLILPWNIASEIIPLVAGLVPTARCWTAVPNMRLRTG